MESMRESPTTESGLKARCPIQYSALALLQPTLHHPKRHDFITVHFIAIVYKENQQIHDPWATQAEQDDMLKLRWFD